MLSVVASKRLILASSSPRRRQLLGDLGIDFEIVSPDVDETKLASESPRSMVERLSLLKATAVAKANPQAYVIGADTTVALEGVVLGKPIDTADACAILGKLQGTKHVVFSSYAIVCLDRGLSHVRSLQTAVKMIAMSEQFIEKYVASGEPMDKAGAYAIQGLGGMLVEEIFGSYTNVVGLPLPELVADLIQVGVIEVA